MTGVASALLNVAQVLGAWTALSVISAPILVVCVRRRARANARVTRRMRYDGWMSSRS
jgi:hypothetical protein